MLFLVFRSPITQTAPPSDPLPPFHRFPANTRLAAAAKRVRTFVLALRVQSRFAYFQARGKSREMLKANSAKRKDRVPGEILSHFLLLLSILVTGDDDF